MVLGRIEFEKPSEEAKKRFAEMLTSRRIKVEFVSPEIKIVPMGWLCPSCGVGVRHDVEVCPNCVKSKKAKTEIKE